MWNNVDEVYCKPWLVLPTVYSDALSYGEQLNKFCYVLNQLIENNNQLPDYIKNLIKEYIEGGAIGNEIKEVLSTYMISVKFPPNNITPAIGDGTTDDTEAIQGCIDYAENIGGGIVFFPSGVYLTQNLTLKNNVGLYGMGRYGTRIVLKGGATLPLIISNTSNHSLVGLTFDCNSEVQVNDINTLVFTGDNLLLNDCLIKGGNYALSFNGGGVFDISHVYFDSANVYGLVVSGNAVVTANSLYFKSISSVNGNAGMYINSDGGYYSDIIIDAVVPIGVKCDGNNNVFKIRANNATLDYTDKYNSNSWDVANKTKVERYDNVQTNIAGDNVVNGSHLEENYNEASENISGTKTEHYGNIETNITGNNIVNGGKLVEKYNDSTENVVNKAINATDIILNSIQPLTYNKLEKYNNKYIIPMKGDTNYYLLASTNKIFNLDFANVKDYNAVGDGVTDDTNAFKEALNSGKSLLIPDGTYKITDSLVLNDGQSICGNGTLLHGTLDDYFITLSNHSYILGIKIKGGGATDPFKVNRGEIYAKNKTMIKIINCEIYNTNYRHCIKLESCNNVIIKNNYIHDFSYCAISLQYGTNNVVVDGNILENCVNTKNANCYYIYLSGYETYIDGDYPSAEHIICINNIIKDKLSKWEGIDSHGMKHSIVANNTIYNCANAIALIRDTNSHSEFYFDDVICCNNSMFGDNTGFCGISISCDDTTKISVNNNIIEGYGFRTELAYPIGGIDINNASDVNINGNMIRNCGFSGITFRSHLKNGIINGNLIKNITTVVENNNGIFFNSNNYYKAYICDNYIDTVINGVKITSVETANKTYIECKNNIIENCTEEYSGRDIIVTDRDNESPETRNNTYARKGHICYNTSPISGGEPGWICTENGTPGTTPAKYSKLANIQ